MSDAAQDLRRMIQAVADGGSPELAHQMERALVALEQEHVNEAIETVERLEIALDAHGHLEECPRRDERKRARGDACLPGCPVHVTLDSLRGRT